MAGRRAVAKAAGRHMPGALPWWSGLRDLRYRVPEQPSLDGNTVDMNRERVQFADSAGRCQAALSLLNGRIQGLKSAMQPE